MSYYNPITTIASVGVGSTPVPVTIVSETAPTKRDNGSDLVPILGLSDFDPLPLPRQMSNKFLSSPVVAQMRDDGVSISDLSPNRRLGLDWRLSVF